MCPSYRATLDERDVTRGRANTLRLAISGQLGPDAFASDGVLETLSLCVSCKGCRRECPTGVDIARMKIEVLHARAQAARLELARPARRLSAALCALWRATGAAAQSARPAAGAAAASERLLGFSAKRRPLPRWRSDSYRAPAEGHGREVVLLADTFNRYFEPENLTAAHAVLSAAGYRVIEPSPAGERPLVLRAHVPGRRPRRGGAP
jgi:Fe-S oxidoreductase